MEKNNSKTVTLTIDGMHCVSCSLLVDDALEELPGVASARTSYATGTTTLTVDPATFSKSAAVSAIAALGYSVAA